MAGVIVAGMRLADLTLRQVMIVANCLLAAVPVVETLWRRSHQLGALRKPPVTGQKSAYTGCNGYEGDCQD